jgi:hypothetical protein
MSDTTQNRAVNWFTPWRFAILLALFIFAAFPQVLLGLQTFVVRDYGYYSYPVAFFQQRCFRHGGLPFWDPYNFCGVPFLAQWNTMPLYPPALIYLALPLTWSLSFFCLLHLWFAGFGMFHLARRWTGNDFAAAFAGVAFAFNGLTLNLLMWPGHIATLSWMPWVVLTVEGAWREGGRKIFLAAIVGALQMLAGGPETIFLTWLLLLAMWIQQLITGGGGAASPVLSSATGASQPRMAMFRRFPVVVLLVIALTVVQLLPFLDLAAHSERHGNFADFRWSMPAWGWVNFLVPMAFGGTANSGVFFQHDQFWTSSYYLGIGTLWLALLTVLTARSGRVRLLGTAAVVALVFALGDHTPVYPALHRLIPLLSLITYPVKFVLLVAFIAPLLAAFGLAAMRERTDSARRIVFLGAILLALIGGIMFWAQRFSMPGDDVRATLLNGLSRAGFLLATGTLLLLLARSVGIALRRVLPLLLLAVAWLDVLTHEPTQNPTTPPKNYYDLNLARTKLAMNPQPELGGSRAMLTPMAAYLFVHSAISSPQTTFLIGRLAYGADCNLLDAVPKVDGFFSLMPRECDEFQSLLYTATNADFPRLDDFLGVSQMTAPDQIYHWQSRSNFLPLVTTGQQPVFLDDAETLRALMQPDFDGGKIVFLPLDVTKMTEWKSFGKISAKILNSKFGDDTVDAAVEGSTPSFVVVAQTYYHNWRVTIDGQPAELLRANHAFQAVEVPAGRHQVHFFYQDRTFDAGAAVSIAAWLGCLLAIISFRRRR